MTIVTRRFFAMAGSNLPVVIERPPVLKPEANKPAVKPPERYVVLMHDDDSTPHPFVVKVLQEKFAKSPSEAFQIMLAAEAKGKAAVVTLPRDLAEAKAIQANDFARSYQHPHRDMPMQLFFSITPL